MGTCKDCKHWVQYRQKKGACKLASSTNEIPDHPSLAMAIGFCVEYPNAKIHFNLETMPEFGCNQFQPIEQEHP